ncbi:FecR family protein [Halorhodospira halophila]|uniref:FecR protein domain-containing protein n=1 Tax=Halorhodospira halophila (strain DSM 244 / SL1) TaxID=349124 RepID=A1WTT6_HALHL|nr:FecR domain-containing protein [Halorhodospira halophila]ABM61098.1 hypothetical protein Hhal_0304 [Halorhodospira halophila SL1]MBK1729815.1 hypothetical protein [Halorhodospira halophila]
MTTEPGRAAAPLVLAAAVLGGTAGYIPLVAAEERIGIVLANRGDPVLIRDGEEQPVGRRDEIRAGDRLKTDDRSRLQMRLNDGQTLSLTENTELHIEAYHFDEDSGAGESRKSLIEGGLRAITGQISGEDDYTIETEVATIGIRGTIFELAHSDGITAGGTPRGRGYAENRGDNRQRINTGDDARTDYYRVVDADLPPEALPERPAELAALDEAAPDTPEDSEATDENGSQPSEDDAEETSTDEQQASEETEGDMDTPEDSDLPATVDAPVEPATDDGIAVAQQETAAKEAEDDTDDIDDTVELDHDLLVDINPDAAGVVPEPGESFVYIRGDARGADDPLFFRTPTLEEREEMAREGDWDFHADDEQEEFGPATGEWGYWFETDSDEIGGFWIQGESYVDEVDLEPEEELPFYGGWVEAGWSRGLLGDQGAAFEDARITIAEDQAVTLEHFEIRQYRPDHENHLIWRTDRKDTNLGALAEGINVSGDILILGESADGFSGDLAAMLSQMDETLELLGEFDFQADDNEDWAVDGVFFLELDD